MPRIKIIKNRKKFGKNRACYGGVEDVGNGRRRPGAPFQ
jgi:hypothetical protein